MCAAVVIQKLRRRDPDVARIVHDWRRLTSAPDARQAGRGEPTVVACSGGADSSALVLALASATDRLVVAHVLHDLRPRAQVEADRDAVRALAAACDLPFIEADVQVADLAGNAEGNARRARYAALGAMAIERRFQFVATAHHADDQLETILMRMLRGAGAGGCRGVLRRRNLLTEPFPVSVIRPMLSVDRETCRRLCREAGFAWREDPTNGDLGRVRNKLRRQVIPVLRELRPDVGGRAMAISDLFTEVHTLIREGVDELWPACAQLQESESDGAGYAWARGTLARRSPLVIGAVVRRAHRRLCSERGLDRLGSPQLGPLIKAVQDRSNEPRQFEMAGIRVKVTAHAVEIRRR